MGNSALIALSVVCCASTARATTPVDASPGVVFEDCKEAPLGTAAFLRALGVELGNSATPSNDRDAPRIAVTFGCNGVARIRISVGQSSEERDVRLDDVPSSERPRALALVIAELVQSRVATSWEAPPQAATRGRTPAASAGADDPRSPRRPLDAQQAVDSPEPTGPAAAEAKQPKFRYWCGIAARLSSGGGNPSYGGQAAVDRGAYRIQADALFAHARVSRGFINAGLAALRLRRALPLLASPNIEFELGVSGALGATWAVGASDVPGTIVKRVLLPYADARVGAALVLSPVPDFASGFELYAGRAAGLLSRADGVATLAVGGWFIGLEAGIRL